MLACRVVIQLRNNLLLLNLFRFSGGGKPKMRWYFNKHGWPTSTILPEAPQGEDEQAKLIDTLQDWKSEKYRDFIGSGKVLPRPGIVEVRVFTTALLPGLMLVFFSSFMKNRNSLFLFLFPFAFCFSASLAVGIVLAVYRVR